MITGIGHVAFRVTNLQRALDFYCNTLGFSEAFRLEQEGQPSPWIVYIQIAPGSFIELFPDSQDAPGTIPARDLQASYKHVCLLVDDMSTTLSDLAARGLEITKAPTQGLDHNLQYWINDPDGNPIELMQIMPNSPQATADTRKQIRSGL
jgi:catechol 2,3-dioxygenase-like lactoylglutathione lyase family enzyme